MRRKTVHIAVDPKFREMLKQEQEEKGLLSIAELSRFKVNENEAKRLKIKKNDFGFL